MAAKRDYKAEYKKFHSSAKAKKKRADCNQKRAEVNSKRKKAGKPQLTKDQVIRHKTKNGKTTTRVGSRRANAGSSTDTQGDRNARSKGSKKRQPKKKR